MNRKLGQRGTVAIMTALVLTALIGFAAISVDAGRIYSSWNKLQASSQAAALAGVKDIGVGGTPLTTATLYGSEVGSKNVISGVTASMISGYPKLKCFVSGPPCTTNQTPATSANGLIVEQSASVPLYFASLFGYPSMTVTASAVALAGSNSGLPPLNVIFIVDTTASMGSTDPVCGMTKIQCAVSGFKTLLGELWPCVYSGSLTTSCGPATNGNVANPLDEAGLMVFPGLQAVPVAGNCAHLTTTAYAGVTGTTSAKSTNSNILSVLPTSPGIFNTGPTALVTDATTPSNMKVGTYVVSTTGKVTTSTTNSTANKDIIDVWPPVYQAVALSSDYRANDASATALNTSSNLVACLNSLSAPGGFGTFYADAITIAQQTLVANARAGTRNVIILLTDGQANATATPTPSNMVSQGTTSPASKNQCQQGVTAAQLAAEAGTWVYTVAYGTPSSGGCTSDTGTYASACSAMRAMANAPGATAGTFVNDLSKFYSDDAGGCQSTSNPNFTSLSTMFQNIEYSLTTARMLPNACLAASPPGWC